jgi:hypothetical protein
MTYKQLIEKLKVLTPEQLDDPVAVSIYSTNDTYTVSSLALTSEFDHLHIGIDTDSFYLVCLDLIN